MDNSTWSYVTCHVIDMILLYVRDRVVDFHSPSKMFRTHNLNNQIPLYGKVILQWDEAQKYFEYKVQWKFK